MSGLPVNGSPFMLDLNPPLANGERLVVTFNVTVPATFNTVGEDPDCVNTVEVEGFTDDTSTTPDCEGMADAEIDVRRPDIDCNKSVSTLDENGSNHGPSSTINLQEENVVFPLTVSYAIQATNPASSSDMDLNDVEICDNDLMTAVFGTIAAGADITIGSCDLCTGLCDDASTATCKQVASLTVGASDTAACDITFGSAEAFRAFATRDAGGDEVCFDNRANVSGEATFGLPQGSPPPCQPDDPDALLVEDSVGCAATICINPPSECTYTKAKFDIWNQNEVKFSGTDRCICDWDQALISEYDPPNHMLVGNLQTDKGKARIDGIASPVVCDDPAAGIESQDAPLLGVAAKMMRFPLRDEGMLAVDPPGDDGLSLVQAAAGMPLIALGKQVGEIRYTPQTSGPERLGGSSDTASIGTRFDLDRTARRTTELDEPENRGTPPVEMSSLTTQKGSLLVYPKVEIKWRGEEVNPSMLVQDTFVSLLNDFPDNVTIQMYFVADAGSRCNAFVDSVIELTGDHPVYWSVSTGSPQTPPPFPIPPPPTAPRPIQVPPFTSIGDGFFTEPDPQNPGQVLTVLRGYVLAWAVDRITGEEIRWNHLAGQAIIVNYAHGYAWEYNAWSFRGLGGVQNGDPLLAPPGRLDLDGVEYNFAPDLLSFDFYATGAHLRSERGGLDWPGVVIDTELTLWPAIKDVSER